MYTDSRNIYSLRRIGIIAENLCSVAYTFIEKYIRLLNASFFKL